MLQLRIGHIKHVIGRRADGLSSFFAMVLRVADHVLYVTYPLGRDWRSWVCRGWRGCSRTPGSGRQIVSALPGQQSWDASWLNGIVKER